MPRKKKVIDIKSFTPSKYQVDIMDFIEHKQGNLLVDASAGCGKTSSLIMVIDKIDKEKSILFCAFNREIVKEIKSRTKEYDNVDVMTVHGLGLRMLRNNLGEDYSLIPKENKYKSHILANIRDYSTIDIYSLGRKLFNKYISNITQLTNLLRLYLCKGSKEAYEIAFMYGIMPIADEIDVVYKVLMWGRTSLDEIDYTDMIWLPHALNLKPLGVQYDYVLGDECQDFSNAQRELLLKCRKINTRFIFVGDENQSIYGFAGSNHESFEKLRNLPNTSTLPLPISYRCAKKIVQFAQNYVPKIEYNQENNSEGEIKYGVSLNEIQDGDMVLCRNNAPLMSIYNKFISEGRKCYIRGKDIGENLISLVRSTNQQVLAKDFSCDGLFVRLYDDLFTLRDNIIKLQRVDEKTATNNQAFISLLDKIKALEVLSEGVENCDELVDKISSVFSDKQLEGISLSTVHKAKGLEAERVFVACNSLMPSKTAEKEWQKQQEKNLM